MKRRIRGKPLLALAAAAGFIVASGIGLHHAQVNRVTRALRARADRAETAGRPVEAAEALAQYLALRPGDDPALIRYAWLLDRTAVLSPARVTTVLERAVLRCPDRADLRRRLAERQAGQGRLAEARAQLDILRAAFPDDPGLEELHGRCDEASNDCAQAALWYERALSHDPNRPAVAARLADLKRRALNDPEAADRVLDALVAAVPGSAAAWLARARYRQTWALAGADDDVARARRIDPDNPDVLLETARSARLRSAFHEARTALDRGLTTCPSDPRFFSERAALELAAGRPDLAEAVLRRGLDARPDLSALRWFLANLLAERGDAAGLSDQLERLRSDPDVYPAPTLDYLAAWKLFGLGRWADAARLLERVEPALAPWPELRSRAACLLARSQNRLGRHDREADAYRRALDLDPVRPDACLGLAGALVALGQTEEAFHEYHRLQPDRPEGILTLAESLARSGHGAAALDLCELAWESRRGGAVARALVAVLDASDADAPTLDGAARRLALAVDASPASAAMRASLASVRELQGQFDDAERLYRSALAVEPRDPAALNNLAVLLALRDGQGREPLDLVNRAIDAAGPLAPLLDTRGLVLLCSGDAPGAVDDLTTSAASTGSGLTYFHLAQARLRSGRPDLARASLDRLRSVLTPSTRRAIAREERLRPGAWNELTRIDDRLAVPPLKSQ